MKHRLILLLTLFVILFGCSEDFMQSDLTTENDIDLKKKNGKAVTRPYKVRTEGTISFIENHCGEGIDLEVIRGKGNATHLGLFTLELEYCLDGISGPAGKQIAANGDELWSYMSEPPGTDEEGFYMVYAIYGGTGRFENATGSVKLYMEFGVDEFGNMTFSNHGIGTLTY